MNTQELIDTAKALVVSDKGLLAMDESNPTCNKRYWRRMARGRERIRDFRSIRNELVLTEKVNITQRATEEKGVPPRKIEYFLSLCLSANSLFISVKCFSV